MAEKGAHLSQTNLKNPTIFEVVAQQTLSSTLQPALKRLVEFLGSFHPTRFTWLEKHFDEVLLGLNCVLQSHYLAHHGGSFSEVFYGLCRVPIQTELKDLDKKGKIFSLLELAFLPYLLQKIDKIVQNMHDAQASGFYSDGKKKLLVRLLLGMHLFSRVTWETAVLSYYLAFLGGKSKCHSPVFHLLGLALTYSKEDDVEAAWEEAATCNRFSPKNIGYGFLRVLEVGAFILQFLQWWHGEQSTTNVASLPIPYPPQGQEDDLKQICPICRKLWKIETLLPVSGYVFCFQCIMQYIQTHGSCPVTGYPASSQDLIRLYK